MFGTLQECGNNDLITLCFNIRPEIVVVVVVVVVVACNNNNLSFSATNLF
jgi:hypothetical protein